jgi:aminoglycoside phosphotransferase (APT) family kinase protein
VDNALSPAVLAWIESHIHERVVDVTSLSGGWTSRMLALRDAAGRSGVLRSMQHEPWRRHGAELVTRERSVHRLLETTPVLAPMSVAIDANGDVTGDPTHLMTRLPGRLVLDRSDDDLLDALASMLATIHKVTTVERPRDFQSWAGPEKRVVPVWTRDAAVWCEAFEILEETPSFRGVFLHRDLHLGNVLWRGNQISGVVDWVETSWGPAWLDVAHCRTNLAMLHGPEAAERFATAYEKHAGGVDEPGREYWDVMDIVGFLPDPIKVVQPWRDQGRDVSDRTARDRIERHLRRVLAK